MTMPGRQSRKRSSDDSRTLLEIYLRDHHAAAAGGVDLARRLASHDRSLARLAEQIADDRAQLTRLLGLLEIGPNPAKIAAVRIGERLTRLKLNGRLVTLTHRSVTCWSSRHLRSGSPASGRSGGRSR